MLKKFFSLFFCFLRKKIKNIIITSVVFNLHTFNNYILSNFFIRLKQKWKVNWLQFALIFCTFALGGSSCGYLGRKFLDLTSLEKGLTYYILYLVLITVLWPFCVLFISVFLGQYSFFKKYIQKIGKRIFGIKS